MPWDWSDCKRDASSAKTSLCKTSFISMCFGTLSSGTNTKTPPRSCRGLVTTLRPPKLQRRMRKRIPFWLCEIKSNPNQPYHWHWSNVDLLSMLQIHHIGWLNRWLNHICNKRFCHFHIEVTITQTMMISFYVEDWKETMKKPRDSANWNKS